MDTSLVENIDTDMTDRSRMLLFKVLDASSLNQAMVGMHRNIGMYLEFIMRVKSPPNHDDILMWLIKMGLTGEDFYNWYWREHRFTQLSLVAFVRMQIRKDITTRPLYVGRDVT